MLAARLLSAHRRFHSEADVLTGVSESGEKRDSVCGVHLSDAGVAFVEVVGESVAKAFAVEKSFGMRIDNDSRERLLRSFGVGGASRVVALSTVAFRSSGGAAFLPNLDRRLLDDLVALSVRGSAGGAEAWTVAGGL